MPRRGKWSKKRESLSLGRLAMAIVGRTMISQTFQLPNCEQIQISGDQFGSKIELTF